MKKREFLKTTSVLSVGALMGTLGCGTKQESNQAKAVALSTTFSLPELPYAVDALEPFIDRKTMEIHHGKHHAGYVRKLNAALERAELQVDNLGDLLATLTDAEGQIALRNNGGGHFNHSLFWKVMTPGGGQEPKGALLDAMNASFDGLEKFGEEFANAAATQFGSGWAWLCHHPTEKKLFVTSTANQDNPVMEKLVEQPGIPILGVDVWEHAYYLNYQNKRKEYIDNFMRIINWEQVAKNLSTLG